jgi:RimJ/RimL family protein N-acetyltransferase
MARTRKPGEVVEEFDVTGRDAVKRHVVFRYPRIEDAKQAQEYAGAIAKEAKYIMMSKKPTLAEEKKWLQGKVDEIAKGGVTLFVFIRNEFVGAGEVRRRTGWSSHVGIIGISLRELHTGMGIGSRLMAALEREAAAAGVEVLQIECICGNNRAKHVYEKMGFRQIGVVPKARKKDGKYDDEMILCKDIGTGR